MARAAELLNYDSLYQLHQLVRKRLKYLKEGHGRGRVYGHDDLAGKSAGDG
jgi:hypothetical protein